MRKKTLLIIGLLCLALTLCACSNEKKQYLGTWKLTKMVSGGTVFTVAEAQKLNGGDQSGEIIFAIQYDHAQGTVGNYLASMSYHYNQKYAFSPEGNWQWSGNGICGQPGLYSSFEEGDVRRNCLMIGQQKSAKDGSNVLMDNGEPLNYTEEISIYDFAGSASGTYKRKQNLVRRSMRARTFRS